MPEQVHQFSQAILSTWCESSDLYIQEREVKNATVIQDIAAMRTRSHQGQQGSGKNLYLPFFWGWLMTQPSFMAMCPTFTLSYHKPCLAFNPWKSTAWQKWTVFIWLCHPVKWHFDFVELLCLMQWKLNFSTSLEQ